MNTHKELAGIVERAKCKPGWTFRLVRIEGDFLELVITVCGVNSARPDEFSPIAVSHHFPVPEATYNEKSWSRWVFERCRLLENHELGEWFRIGDDRPFQPLHGPGEDPYVVHEFRDAVDGLTTQDGSIRKPYPG